MAAEASSVLGGASGPDGRVDLAQAILRVLLNLEVAVGEVRDQVAALRQERREGVSLSPSSIGGSNGRG